MPLWCGRPGIAVIAGILGSGDAVPESGNPWNPRPPWPGRGSSVGSVPSAARGPFDGLARPNAEAHGAPGTVGFSLGSVSPVFRRSRSRRRYTLRRPESPTVQRNPANQMRDVAERESGGSALDFGRHVRRALLRHLLDLLAALLGVVARGALEEVVPAALRLLGQR